MVPYNHYLEIKYENINVIDVEELIIMHIYVYVLCSIFLLLQLSWPLIFYANMSILQLIVFTPTS